ncbi:hypothetical protein [Streptomyces sp. ODS28]|uniref:hypothetical protein n=1 Tax=Streptomyces sp. ODS28 TaxID=3136688 RepID=UPI0031ED7C8F
MSAPAASAKRTAATGPGDPLEQASRLTLGLADLTLRALRDLLGHAGAPHPDRHPDPRSAPAPAADPPYDLPALLPAAAVALALAAQRRSVRAARDAGSRLRPVLAFAARPLAPFAPPPAWGPLPVVRGFLERWGAAGVAEQRRNRALAERFVRELVRGAAALVLAETDLDGAADRLDLDRAAAHLDVDAVVARADLDAVVRRLDLADLVTKVLDETDFSRVVRESSGTMAEETVEALRDHTAAADRAVNRVTDRLLRRPGGRDTTGPLPQPEGR